MPGFVTHYLYGIDIYKHMNNLHLKRIIHKYPQAYSLGLQGPDIFFYHIPFLKFSDCRNIGSYMHENNINDFFENSLQNIPHLKSLEEKKMALAYFCGFLCHYTLDHHIHPYVYSRSKYQKHKNNRLCIGYHLALETEIDRILLEEKKNLPLTKFDQGATLNIPLHQKHILSKYINGILKDTFHDEFKYYGFKLSPKLLRQIIVEARVISSLLLDPYCIKKNISLFIEKHFLHYTVLSTKFITNCPTPIIDPLNLNKRYFENTWDTNVGTYNSIPTMYETALNKCIKLFSLLPLRPLLNGTLEEVSLNHILKEIGNYSYHSGLPTK
jgi:hypothetical protein